MNFSDPHSLHRPSRFWASKLSLIPPYLIFLSKVVLSYRSFFSPNNFVFLPPLPQPDIRISLTLCSNATSSSRPSPNTAIDWDSLPTNIFSPVCPELSSPTLLYCRTQHLRKSQTTMPTPHHTSTPQLQAFLTYAISTILPYRPEAKTCLLSRVKDQYVSPITYPLLRLEGQGHTGSRWQSLDTNSRTHPQHHHKHCTPLHFWLQNLKSAAHPTRELFILVPIPL